MKITGTHINYYLVCHRKLWLFANSIQMEHSSDLVSEGRLIHETTYPQRSSRYEEIEIEGIKIDFYDPKEKVIHEIKKTNKLEEAHLWQLKYYIFVLEKNGIKGVKGLLEYPKMRRTEEVCLSEKDKKELLFFKEEIKNIINSDECPEKVEMKICRKCSYYDFCWIGEMTED